MKTNTLGPAVTRVVLKNFKSIQSCNVELKPMTLLVGPNGSGKSNFVDALRLTRDALRTTLENAIRDRGGVDDVRRRSTGHPNNFGIRLDISIPGGRAEYAYQVMAQKEFTFEVQREECRVFGESGQVASFIAMNGEVSVSGADFGSAKVARNSLALPLVGALGPFAAVAETLQGLGFYSFNPNSVRELQNSDMGEVLSEDGSNLASVVRRLRTSSPKTLQRVVEYLAAVVPGIDSVTDKSFGPKETVEFRQEVAGDKRPWKFLASSVSDGTLRALCVLVAAYQGTAPLIAIEEPETAIHPGASHRLMDALLESSQTRQVLLTTHSPDLLDHPGIDVDSVVAVQSSRGTTQLGGVDANIKLAVRDNLYTVGELLRLEQVKPEVFAFSPAEARLF